MTRNLLCLITFLLSGAATYFQPAQLSAQDNPFAYLDAYSDSYYPNTDFPKLTTPQWVGEPGVEAVVTLGIDDMRDTAQYEAYLRPILDRLKKIDGRSPVSIMSCKIDPQDPQLQKWLKEGLSIETHTVDHPCPCLQSGNFDQAKSTYDRCVDQMFAIPNTRPVAFRFPCMDSKNTPSPRAFAEIVNQTTPAGNFLQASTSVVCVFNSSDPDIPKSITLNAEGKERFERYIPFPSFVNKIHNYPYPFVIGKQCWEFPCTIPDDWQAQNIQQPNNPQTVDDMMAAIDATVIKKGIANLVFHPYAWIRNEQMAELVDRVDTKYGKRVKFLTFKESMERINRHLLLDQPVRNPKTGDDNGVRLVDLNQDGFLDVVIGNDQLKIARLWDPKANQWIDLPSKVQFVHADPSGHSVDRGVQFGKLKKGKGVSMLVNNDVDQHIYHFSNNEIVSEPIPEELKPFKTNRDGIDQGVRLRDLDLDGISEVLIANPTTKQALSLDGKTNKWTANSQPLPFPIVDADGDDNGLRFVDLDKDGYDDMIVSNAAQSAVQLYDSNSNSFTRAVTPTGTIPLIVRGKTNNGAWFAEDHMWIQNEDTHRLPDGVDRRSFSDLTGNADPGPRSADRSFQSMRVRPGFTIQMVASEPLVMDPVALDFAPDGKLWVAEMADYPLGLDDKGKPGGRIRYLEDTDNDGTYDSSTLFLDNIAYPTGVLVTGKGVIVSAAPTIFYAEDTDGDGKADLKTELYRGFTEGNQQHLVNGFERGLDNWLYVANGDSGGTVKSIKTGETVEIRGQDLRIRPDTGAMELQAGQTQFGRHRDDQGNWFGCNNSIPVRHYIHPAQYLRRNRFVPPPSASRDIARINNTQLFPISRVLSHWSGYVPPAPGTGHQFTSACSTVVYRDSLFGPDFAQNTFTCEPVHNAVHRRRLVPAGASFESVRPSDESNFEFLASEDSWFRPASVTTGPDGALWVADMYRLVIEHPEWIGDDREKELFLRAGHDKGRIYRIFPTDNPPRQIPILSDMDLDELVAQLESPNGRTRDLAQALLIDRQEPASIPILTRMAQTSATPLGRLHAICTLDGLEALSPATLIAALQDSDPTVRRHALRLSEPWLAMTSPDGEAVLNQVIQCAADQPQVLLQKAYSLGFSTTKQAAKTLADLAFASQEIPEIRAAIISSLQPETLAFFYKALESNPKVSSTYRDAIFEMAVRSGQTEFLTQLVGELAKSLESTNVQAQDIDTLTQTLTVLRQQKIQLDESAESALAGIVPLSAERVSDRDAKTSLRIASLRFLAATDLNLTLFPELLSAAEPVELQIAAAEILAQSNSAPLIERLETLSPTVRAATLNAILTREAATLQLINAIKTERLTANTLTDSHRRQLLTHASESVQQEATQMFASPGSETAKHPIIQKYLSSDFTQGDAQRGREVFVKQCAACHQMNEVGNAIGPDIASLKDRSPKAIVTAVLDPNLAVEEKYQAYNVLTIDGKAITGIIQSESSTAIELQMQDNKRLTILRDDIEWIRNTGASLMPEGFEKAISPSDMAHLLAFLGSARTPPKSFPGNTPQPISADPQGALHLTATTARIYGDSCVFEPKYQNIGHWGSPTDQVEWTLEVKEEGSYDVWLDYACAKTTAGNGFVFACGTEDLSGRVESTGNWDTYQKIKVGSIRVSAGQSIATFRAAEGLDQWLLDLRSIQLTPAE